MLGAKRFKCQQVWFNASLSGRNSWMQTSKVENIWLISIKHMRPGSWRMEMRADDIRDDEQHKITSAVQYVTVNVWCSVFSNVIFLHCFLTNDLYCMLTLLSPKRLLRKENVRCQKTARNVFTGRGQTEATWFRFSWIRLRHIRVYWVKRLERYEKVRGKLIKSNVVEFKWLLDTLGSSSVTASRESIVRINRKAEGKFETESVF